MVRITVMYDSDSYHGPEVELLMRAEQVELNFNDADLVERKLKWLFENPEVVERLGSKIYSIGRDHFSVEHMVEVHLMAFGAS